MKKILYISVFIADLALLAGCSNSAEKISKEYCDCIEENQQLPVSERISECEKVLGDLYAWDDDEQTIQNKNRQVDSILRSSCADYNEILKSMVFDNGEWIPLDTDKTTKLTEDGCTEFKSYQNFYYLEPNGDTTKLKIIDDLWIDNFAGGKYNSYLKMKWLTPCDFQIELVETTEPQRKATFKRGDVFQYRILDKTDTYFLMMVSFDDIRQEFKLYIDN